MHVSLDDGEIERIAQRVAALLGASEDSPWLSAVEAADHMRCPISRIRKLTMTGDLPVHKDGARALYRRDELNAFIESGGASTK